MINWKNKEILFSALVAVVLIVAGVFYTVKSDKEESPQQVADKTIEFINKNLLQPGTTASFATMTEENGLYKLKVKVGTAEPEVYVTKNGKLLFVQGAIDMSPATTTENQTENSEETKSTIGNFLVSSDEICQENGKPIIYFFGSETCPHCQWEKPIIGAVSSEFKENIAFHNNMDSNEDADVFGKYSAGGVPTLVFGCKYYRVGSGESLGAKEEAKVLTALICKLTQNLPADVCGPISDLINQIK